MPLPSAGSAIQYKTLNQLVQMQMNFIVANIPATLSKPLGPFLTAICYATALVALVLQRLVQLALMAARLSTASGTDIDSFVADFQLTRLPAVAATGQVTFARFTPAPAPILVPVGSTLVTGGAPSVQYTVVPPIVVKTLTTLGCTTTVLKVASNYGMSINDSISVDGFAFVSGTNTIASLPDANTINLNGTLSGAPGAGVGVTDASANPAFSAVQNGYVMAAGLSSVVGSVQAAVAGSSGNAAIGTINKLSTALSGIDTVFNSVALTNGLDPESDSALQVRFALFILGLSKATKMAVLSAIANIQQGLLVNVSESFGTTTIAGSSGTTLKVASTSGIAQNDTLQIGGFSATFTVSAVVDLQTITLGQNLGSSPPGAGVTVADLSINPGGNFNVAVDDGSGALGSNILSQCQAAVDLVRPIGVRAIVTAASATQLGIYLRVIYGIISTPNVLTLQAVVRSAVLSFVNALKPGDKLHYGALYRTIFEAASPGDAVSTTVAATPLSTTKVIQVGSTTGMSAGQVVAIDVLTTASGGLPLIASVDSDVQFTLATPLVTPPIAGQVVTTFSTSEDQIKNILLVQTNTVALATSNSGGSATTSQLVLPTGLSGISAGMYIVVTDESNTSAPVYYQGTPGIPLTVASYTGGSGILTFQNSALIGVINAAGVFTPQAPPNSVNTKVVLFSPGSTDITPGALACLRVRGLGPNQLTVQMEGE